MAGAGGRLEAARCRQTLPLRLVAISVGVLLTAGCGDVVAPNATASAAPAAIAQDDCTSAGITGTPLRGDAYGKAFSMILAPGWTQSTVMGGQGVIWGATNDADPQGTAMTGYTVGVAPDALSAATEDAHTQGVPVLTCTVGGEKAYLVAFKGPQGATQYAIYVRLVAMEITSSGRVADSVWIPQVKQMLGSWTWG